MNRQCILRIGFHGALLVVIGMLIGLPFAVAITSNAGPDAVRAWRVAHTSLVTAGTLYLAIAAIAQYLTLPGRATAFVTWSLSLSAYALVFALVVGPMVGARGLEPSGPALNIIIFWVFVVSILDVFLSVVVVLWGLFAALRAASE